MYLVLTREKIDGMKNNDEPFYRSFYETVNHA